MPSGYVTSLHKVAPCHSGYLTPLRSPVPDHDRITMKCRAGQWCRNGHPPWFHSGYVTSLRPPAPADCSILQRMRAGAATRSCRSLWRLHHFSKNAERVRHVAARGRSRLERVAHLAPVGRFSSSTRPMIIFYFFLNHNTSKYLQNLQRTLQHLIKTYVCKWNLKMPKY